MAPTTAIDATGVDALKEVIALLAERPGGPCRLVLANPNRVVLEALARAGVIALLGGQSSVFFRAHEAVDACLERIAAEPPGESPPDLARTPASRKSGSEHEGVQVTENAKPPARHGRRGGMQKALERIQTRRLNKGREMHGSADLGL